MREKDRPSEFIRVDAVQRVKRQRIRASNARKQKNRVHGIGWSVSREPDAQGGQARLDEQDQNERARHRLPRDAARR